MSGCISRTPCLVVRSQGCMLPTPLGRASWQRVSSEDRIEHQFADRQSKQSCRDE